MGEEEAKKVEEQVSKDEEETPKDVADEEKSVIAVPDETKAIVPVATPPTEPEKTKSAGGSIDRDIVMARVAQDKKLALIKAWEDTEKTKAENKACRKLLGVDSWENTQKAAIEAQLKKTEEKLENMKAEAAEKMKNKIAEIHRIAEERRAMVEAKKGEEILKAEEFAAKFRATGKTPKKMIGCFSC
uniref:Remorin C-terminal domain-containing protein n=1 Tax=Opuntia streptacantha TaxID=393608 RepID=A0A7C8YZK9_OPUST